MGITEEQRKILADKMQEKRKKVIEGKGSFKMEDYDCKHYFGVINETMHRPMCSVLERDEENNKVYVKAIFFGSGIASHPVRKAWIPESAVSIDVNNLLYWKFLIMNLFIKGQTYI